MACCLLLQALLHRRWRHTHTAHSLLGPAASMQRGESGWLAA